MEIILGQLVVSLLTLSSLVTPVEAEIQPWSMPTDRVCETVKCPRVKVPNLLWEIGRCESGHSLTAKNPGSTAKGEYQFVKSSWRHYGLELWGEDWIKKDIFSKDNEELAMYVYNKYGTKDWNESKSCWSKSVSLDV